MTRTALAISALVVGFLPGMARAQVASDTSLAERLETAPEIGDDARFVRFSPFVQFDGGWASSSPDDLVAQADRRNGEVRRGRLYVDFGFDQIGGRLTVDFANLETDPVTYAYLNYEVGDALTVQAGYQDVTFSMQQLMGSRSATFAEDGQNAGLQLTDAVGVAALAGGERWSFNGGVFGGDINRQPFDDGVTVAGRGTYAPYLDGDDAVHLGLGLAGGFDRQETLSFSGDAGTSLVAASPVSTGDFEGPGKLLSVNLEAAATLGRLTLQSEYTVSRVESRAGGEATLGGGYLSALVFLTDDHRQYEAKSGQFERVKPAQSVTKGGIGAFEIGARLDHLDLSDAEDGGTQLSGTAILNWYPTDVLRFTTSHTYTQVTEGPDDGDEVNATLLRAAIIY
ncbi:OprO/OprP family phosphate-selective porin [Aureimonas pseudogalii]|uniref:Phosphate-selective porin OprO/OprP n=1 Tax=Aureimonas pseudogalii TaxID=1744844 RepID=A0A7W6EE05_9HYPH|nr:porin [Aureimonas pseudogalii]MBB3996463.1 phosphate-selective porin OprO/OprP [Aureimonas pseudogalii]